MEMDGGSRRGSGKGGPPPGPPVKGAGAKGSGKATPACSQRSSDPQVSIAEQIAARRQLRPVAAPEERRHFHDVSGEADAHRQRYFASAADRWMFLPGIAAWTFPTCFLELSCEAARDVLVGEPDTPALRHLQDAIGAEMQNQGWAQAFAKLTTFSPKDSPLVLREAEERLLARPKTPNFSGAKVLQFLSECMTEALGVSDGKKAVRLLCSSARVQSDLKDALDSQDAAEPTPVPNICLRRWDGPLPIWSEFRGFVWEGALNAVGQYVYNIHFDELQDAETLERVTSDILDAWRTLGPILTPSQPTCIIDFAWNPAGFSWAGGKKVILIEVNPFDGCELGMGELTTGIFKLRDDPRDLEIVKTGPFELRVKRDPMTDEEFRMMVRGLPSKQREMFERLEGL